MSQNGDGPDDTGGKVEAATDIPTTRKHETVDPEAEPPLRPSAMQLLAAREHFPDDGPVSGLLRKVDKHLGRLEQVILFGLLIVIVGVGAVQALATKIFQHSFLWSFDVIRAGTFAIALLAAAFASQQASHLSMDLVSRRVTAHTRVLLRIVLGAITIFATALLLNSGLHLREQFATEGGTHVIPSDLIASVIPLGCALIIVHTALHMLIDIDYMRRGKLPPERAPSAH